MNANQLKAMEQTLTLTLRDLTGPAASRELADVWRGAHGEVVAAARARAGVEPDYLVAVDNQQGKPVEQAQQAIVSLYDYRREVATATLAALIRNSPKRSGAYIAGHTVYVNGHPVGQQVPPLKPGDSVFIANTVPYARRLEIGRTAAGRSFVVQVPERIYERTAKREIAPVYRNVVKVVFEYVDLAGAYTVKGGLGASYLVSERRQRRSKLGEAGTQKRRLRRQKVGEPIRFPAIRIEAL